MELKVLSTAILELLKARRLSDSYLKKYKYAWAVIGRFIARNYGDDEYDESRGSRFLLECCGLEKGTDSTDTIPLQRHYMRAVRTLDVYLKEGRLAQYDRHRRKDIALPEGFETAYRQYCDYLDSEGLSEGTVSELKVRSQNFLEYLAGRGLESVRELKLEDCLDYLGSFAGCRSTTIQRLAYQTRRFLKFLFPRWLDADLASFLKSKHSTGQSRIPSTFEAEELKALIEAIDLKKPLGRRNYAIVLLASVLGLRAVDIRRLSFSNIDWRKPAVNIVQSKTGKSLSLPMPIEVGDAVIDYIRNGRHNDTGSDTIFQSSIPPFKPFGMSSALSDLLRTPLRKAHINTEGRHHGLHALRHTNAKMMLEAGTSLPIIAGILGHSTINSTAVYLKVDRKLAECALDPKEFEDGL